MTAALMGDPRPGRTPWAPPAFPAERFIGSTLADALSARRLPTVNTMSDGVVPLADPAAPAPERALRAIAPVDFDMPLAFRPIPTDAPGIEWLSPSELLVDESYQRDLSAAGRTLVRKIAETFDWRKFKPPIVAWTDNGYEVVDGQHTALGAILRDDVEKIPVLVILALGLDDRASAFVGHNTDRLGVTPMQLHHARVTAKDPAALEVVRVCAAAGVNLVQNYYGEYPWEQGDTVSVTTIEKLVRKRGPDRAIALLKVLVDANLPPIKADQIKAVEYVFSEAYFADRLEPLPAGGAHIAKTIHDSGLEVMQEVQILAKKEKMPVWKSLGMTWFHRCKHKRVT